MSHRIMVYWQPRRSAIEAQGDALGRAIAALQQCGGAFREWSAVAPKTGALSPVRTARDAQELLRRGSVKWKTGKDEHTSYVAHLTTTQAPGFADLRLTTGIEPMNLERIFTPNRAELVIDARASELAQGTFQYLISAMVDAWEPLFGFAGTTETPAPPTAIFSDGRPPVGWLTFLSRAYPPLPLAYPQPSTMYELQGGTLIVAHPDLFNPIDPAHTAAVERVQAALGQAGVLLPHYEVAPA